ncbi:MAG: ABC transporter permease [Bacteroidales bacterium]|nr:ABC transporter permease [Bacteroidales bacterium]
MNTELYIARRIVPRKNNTNISKPIVRIAIIAIALGLAVMIVAVSVILGFKSTISEKIFGFSAHIQIVNYDTNNSFEAQPISFNATLAHEIAQEPTVSHIQRFATKPGIVRANTSVKGVIVKGIGEDYDWSFFENHLVAGSTFAVGDSMTNKVLISKQLADVLQVEVGNSIVTTFVPSTAGKQPRKRQFEIAGMYETHLQEIDSRFIIADLRHIQALNSWTEEQISGYEVFLHSHRDLDRAQQAIQELVGFDISPTATRLRVESLRDLMPHIFDWLSILDMNAWVIIILMLLVSGMNMITGLLVIILEKTQSIGILKTLGSSTMSIQKIFLYVGTLIIGKGLLWGNIIGIALCAAQYILHIVPLDPHTYFMSYVPIAFSLPALLALNVGTLIITILMLLLPALIISKISPAEAVRFS